MARIGLTGARGVYGRRLGAALTEAGDSVVAYAGDVRDGAALERFARDIDVLVHGAAIVPVDVVRRDPAAAASVNVGGTAAAAAAAARTGIPVVYLSTSHVYGRKAGPLNEDDALEPAGAYGLSKLQGEEWVRRLAPEHLIVRIFSFFDSEQQPPYLAPTLRRRILEAPPGAALALDGSGSSRDIVDARWSAALTARLIAGGARGVLNCGSGRGHTVAEVARMLAEALGRPDVRWTPTEGAFDAIVADTTRLTAALGAPLPPADLADQLRRMAREAA